MCGKGGFERLLITRRNTPPMRICVIGLMTAYRHQCPGFAPSLNLLDAVRLEFEPSSALQATNLRAHIVLKPINNTNALHDQMLTHCTLDHLLFSTVLEGYRVGRSGDARCSSEGFIEVQIC